MPSLPTTLPPLEPRSPFGLLRTLLAGERKAEPPVAERRLDCAPSFALVEHTGADRRLAEQFIGQRFFASFGSRVDSFMPRLFTLRNQDGDICGACGLRSASRKLFLEQYLDLPIEAAIAERTGTGVGRQDIVEVGHFSGTFPGAVRAMICLLTERLHREGYGWVTFTGTAGLRNAFHRIGLQPLDIRAADPARLPPDERAAWGSYYEHAPRVLVGNIAEGYRALCRKRAARTAEHAA